MNVDGAEVVGAAVAGGIAGLTLGAGTAALAYFCGTAATTSLMAVPVAAVAGGFGNAVGGQAGALAEAGTRQIGGSEFDTNQFYSDAFSAGFLDTDTVMWDFGSGAILGAAGQTFSNLSTPSIGAKYRYYSQTSDIEGNVIRNPLYMPASLPGEPRNPVISGSFAGFMNETADWTQEIVSQGADRYRQK